MQVDKFDIVFKDVVFVIVVLFAAYLYEKNTELKRDQHPVGRYKIVKVNDYKQYLIDTATGASWQNMHLADIDNKRIQGTEHWTITPHFKDKTKQSEWMSKQFKANRLR